MAGRLEDRAAVITGGASGIGRACALRFAGEGCDVLVADLDEARGAETVAAVKAKGRKATFMRVDTSVEADCEAMADRAMSEFGRIDACVAAAGISHALYVSGTAPRTPSANAQTPSVLTKPVEYWEKVLNVNLTGVMLTNRAVARRMIASGHGGSIVNIASAAAKVPLAGSAEYCVSKAGVWMLTKVLALETAKLGVRVNAIGPGYTDTPMTASAQMDEERMQRMLQMTPLGRLGEAEDIANAALFLASDDSSYVSGEILFVDGAMFTG